MRKLLASIIWILITAVSTPFTAKAQTFKASAYIGSTSTSVVITLKPNFDFNDKLNEAGFALQVPKMVGGVPVVLPTITVLNNFLATTFPTWSQQSESASDPDFYNFKFGATAVGTAPVIPVNNGNELQVIELQLTVPTNVIPVLRLAHLAAGGPSSQYGVAFIDGSLNDRTNYVQMFYGNGVVPASPAPDELTGYNTYQYVLPASVVPVRFLSFNVTERNRQAHLNWIVENEGAGTSHYEMERSSDGRNFERIGIVEKLSTAGNRKSYQETDTDARNFRNAGRIYYRIKQVDTDGRFVYTDIRFIDMTGTEPEWTIYPNPARSNSSVRLELQYGERVMIRVTDAAGKTVLSQSAAGVTGMNIFPVNISKLAPGMYYVKITAGPAEKVLPLIKK